MAEGSQAEHRVAAVDESDGWPPLASIQKKIKDQITCPICLEICSEPRALPCFHVFCLLCLSAIAERNAGDRHLQCPLKCSKLAEIPKGGVAALQVAFHINSLIEIYDSMLEDAPTTPASGNDSSPTPTLPLCANCTSVVASSFCRQCNDFMCVACRDVHAKWPKFSGHSVSVVSAEMLSKREQSCKNHPSQSLTHYCEACRGLVCSECPCSHTRRRTSITDASHQAKDAIIASLEPVRSKRSSIESLIKRISARKQHVSDQASAISSDIDRRFEELIAGLKQRQSQLKEAVKREEEEKVSQLVAQEENAEIARNQLSNYLEGFNHCLQRESKVQVIRKQQSMGGEVKKIMQEFEGLPKEPVEVANLHSYFSPELPDLVPTFGSVQSGGIVATDITLSSDNQLWATACNETSISFFCNEKDADLSQLDLRLSANDGSNTALVETQRNIPYQSNKLTVHFIPIVRGKKKLHVTLRGQEVSNSPLDLIVMAPFRFSGTLVGCIKDLRRPWGVSISKSGQVVVVDNQGWTALHTYNADGSAGRSFVKVSLTQTPDILIGSESCNEPRGVAYSGDGKIFLVDGKRDRILCYTAEGSLSSSAGVRGKKELQFNDPVGITINRTGKVLVCDRRNHRIQVLTQDLKYVRQIGEFGEKDIESGPGLYLPWDVACDSEGQVYIADCGHFCIKVFTSQGQFLRKIGGEGNKSGLFKHISSVCIDRNDNIYALDRDRACVSVFNQRGDLKMEFGTYGSLDGQFCKPLGMAITNGLVYVSDGESKPWPSSAQGRVQIFQ